MYSSAYNRIYDRTIGHEQGFQNDPDDRGNWTTGIVGQGELKGTKGGISAMSYPNLDIRHLTDEQIKAIYYNDWYLKLKLDVRPIAIAYQLFDAAINHGVHNMSRMMQRAMHVTDDGVIGPVTLGKLSTFDLNDFLLLFLAERLDFMNDIKLFSKYGRGWSQRIVENLRYASEDN